MRCQNWPDSRCYSPTACGQFGYCRERNFDHNGKTVDLRRFAQDWRKMDDDGFPPGYSYQGTQALIKERAK